MRRTLTFWLGLLVVPATALAQNDTAAVADVVSIEDRPGYLTAFARISGGEETRAIEELKGILTEFGDDPDAYMGRYNIACALARLGQPDEAMRWLTEAVEGGYGLDPLQIQNLQLDPDLNSLRGTDRFLELQETVGQRFIDMTQNWAELTRPYVYVPEVEEERTEPWPVLLLLHGFADQRQRFAEQFIPFADRHGFVLMAPCPSHQISPGRWAWFFDVAEFLATFRGETREVWLAKQKLQSAHAIDPARIYAVGVGQGAALGFALVERNPQWVRGAVLFGGGYAPSVTYGWLKRAPHWGRRVRLVHGAEDPVWPLEPLRKFVELCGAYELPVALEVHPGGGGLPADFETRLEQALTWVDAAPFERGPVPKDLVEDYESMPQIDPPADQPAPSGPAGHDHGHDHDHDRDRRAPRPREDPDRREEASR